MVDGHEGFYVVVASMVSELYPEHTQARAPGEEGVEADVAAREGQLLERRELDVGRQPEEEHGRVSTYMARGDEEDELLRLEQRGGAKQRGDAGGVGSRLLFGDTDIQEGKPQRGARDAAERRFERGEGDIAEDDVAEDGPEAEPPAGEDAGPRGGADAAEAHEDEEEQVVGQGADAVVLSAAAWSQLLGGTPGTSRARLHRRPDLKYYGVAEQGKPARDTGWPIRASRRGTPEQSDRLVGSLGLGSELSYPTGDLQLGIRPAKNGRMGGEMGMAAGWVEKLG